MAAFMEASMAKGAPALTAPVKPLRRRSSRWWAARTAWSAGGSSSPKGVALGPSSWYVAWKWLLTMPGITVRPPSSTTRSPAAASTDADGGTDGGDATVLHHHGGLGPRSVRIEHGRVAKDEARHVPASYFQPVSTCSNHHCGAAATRTFMSQ